MATEFSHDEIAQKFLESGAVNFEAVAKFVSEFGPDLAVRDKGLHGVVFGRWNTLACMIPAIDVEQLVGNLRIASQVAQAIEGSAEVGRG